MLGMIKRLLRYLAMEHGIAKMAYRKICRPNGNELGDYLRKYGNLYHLGENVCIRPWTVITDPQYVSIGNNVQLGACSLICHDGAIHMLNNAYGVKLDSVDRIIIHDNVFIGHQAIVLPGVTIGPNAIVAAGSVVNKDVAPGDIVAGIPAKPVGRVDTLVEKLAQKTQSLPWGHLIQKREGSFDPEMEPELERIRVQHFFGNKK